MSSSTLSLPSVNLRLQQLQRVDNQGGVSVEHVPVQSVGYSRSEFGIFARNGFSTGSEDLEGQISPGTLVVGVDQTKDFFDILTCHVTSRVVLFRCRQF
jgi:hypothetical protein